jgi:TOMM system kinase/cyclase fusion protein
MDDVTPQGLGTDLKGRYEILQRLGAGGAGTVYQARQLATGQLVALKVLQLPEDIPAPAREKRVARFRREVQLCARVHHPNIVRLIDSGQTRSGAIYTVFEFAPGQDLSRVLAQEGALDPVEARHLMMQLLDALASAHALGVIHRDLKPSNVMVVPTGARRNLLVVDFGIGVLTERSPESRITITQESLGTPAYAAPEQLRGLPPVPASDLYSWGLIFLECLTGERAVVGASAAEIIFKQLSPDPILIPAVLARHPLGELLRKVTAKDPAARDVTAAELLRQLEQLDAGGLPVRVRPPAPLSPPTPDQLSGLSRTGSVTGTDRSLILEGERRQITAVCCTLGAQATGTGAGGLEKVDELLDQQQEACVEVARRFGGHVAGSLGDTVLFYFGYPVAREENARKAAQAALAIQRESRTRNEASAAQHGIRVDVRIGLHTGLVVSLDLGDPALAGMGSVMGATPKHAVRLSAMATPGTILLSADTQRLLRKQFPIEPSGIQVMDSGALLDSYVLSEDADSVLPDELPIVGRDRELQVLLDRWAQARGGAGQVVLLNGEAGIGKSRLSRELRERIAGEAHTWLESRCTPDGATTGLFPIVDLLGQMLETTRGAGPGGKAERLEALLSPYGFDLAEAMPIFAQLLSIPLPPRWPPLDVPAQKLPELTRDAVLSLLFELAEREPVVLLVEDLHWADPSTLELLGHLAADAASTRMFALFTARPELAPPWPSTAVSQLQLGRLGQAEVEQMASRITGGRPLPPEVIEAISSRTDGVPLFVEELVRALIESGALKQDGERFVMSGPLSDVVIPASLRDLLVARLDRLGRAKRTAQVASVIGREFTFELLRALELLEEAEVQEDLDRLVAADLVHRKRRLKNPAYLFKHALVRDAAYESMLKRSRQEVHARIARALVEKFPEVAEGRPDLLALHWEGAGQLMQAARCLHLAGLRAMQRGAHAEAIADFTRAVDLLADWPPVRDRLLLEVEIRNSMSGSLIATRGYCAPELEQNCVRAREVCEKLDRPPEMAPVLYTLWVIHLASSRRAATEEACRQLLEFVRASPDPVHALSAEFAHANTLFYRGRLAEARVAFGRALERYSPDLHPALVKSYGDDHGLFSYVYLGWLELRAGRPDTARAITAKSLALADSFRDPLAQSLALAFAMLLQHDLRDLDRTLELSERALAFTAKQGFWYWHSLAQCAHGWARARQGHAAEGIAEIEKGLSFAHLINQKLPLTYWMGYLAEAHLVAGNVAQGLQVVDEALAMSAVNTDSFNEAELLRLKGELLLAREPAAPAALECFERAVASAAESGSAFLELRAAAGAARLLDRLGRREQGRALLSAALQKVSEGADTVDRIEARELLDRLSLPAASGA